MLEALLHKKEDIEYICALLVSEDRVDAALFETTKAGKVILGKTAKAAYTGEWEAAITAADQAISEIETELPEGKELRKVVFGLFPEWLFEDHIKETYLKRLKQLTSALSLTPLGFVELPTAIVHLLHQDEGAPQTVILAGFEASYVTVSLYKIGKLIGTVTLKRSENVNIDIEKALASFTDIEVLPSRVLVYGTSSDLETIKNEMLNYPWQKKANFLHFPKIELLPDEYGIKAVTIASGKELTTSIPAEVPGEAVTVGDVVAESQAETTNPAVHTTQEIDSDLADLGFEKEPIGEASSAEGIQETDVDTLPQENIHNVVTVPRPTGAVGAGRSLPKFSLPNLQFSLNIPRFKVGAILAVCIVALLFLFGIGYAAAYVLPKATVTILVQPKVLDKTHTVTISTEASSVDAEKGILPASLASVEVSESQTVPTTGKKTVGDKAKGEVTIFNKTLNTKTFKQGTILSSGKLAFTLDSEVNVASASEGLGSLTYGTSKANITARDIGTTSNLDSGNSFSFADLPSSSYTARNDNALAGGTSREIAVVSRDDHKAAKEKAVGGAKETASGKIEEGIESGSTLLKESLIEEIASETYSKEIGEEADEVSSEITVKIAGITYKESDLDELLSQVITAAAPANYEYLPENTTLSVNGIVKNEDETWTFKPHVTVKLLPKLETEELASQLAGKSIEEATSYVRTVTNVSGVEFDTRSILPFFKNSLPRKSSNIKITVATL